MAPSNTSFLIRVPIRIPAFRAWRKASPWIPRATCTVRISSAMSENSLRNNQGPNTPSAESCPYRYAILDGGTKFGTDVADVLTQCGRSFCSQ